MTEYNKEWCDERHKKIDERLEGEDQKMERIAKWLDERIKGVEGRFLAILTGLILNLLGIVGTLLVVLYKTKT